MHKNYKISLRKTMQKRMHSMSKIQDDRQLQSAAAAVINHWDPADMRREYLSQQGIRPKKRRLDNILNGYTADCKSMFKSYWAQWKHTEIRDGIQEHYGESAHRQSKISQAASPLQQNEELVGTNLL
jgi:hypothetical protein